MSPIKHSDGQDFSTTNDHAQHDNQNDSKKRAAPKKVYVHRNSVLTDLMQVSHLQSVYNISVALCSLLFLNAVIFYLAIPSKFWQDISLMKWGAGKFRSFLIMWLSYNIYAYLIYEGFKIWITARNMINAKIADGFFLILYVSSSFLMFGLTAYFMLIIGFPPISGFTIGCEQVRIFMKTYSFVRENVPRARQYKSDTDGKQDSLYPPRNHYIYYLFAPVLIYRDSYPRTEKVQWHKVFYSLFQIFSIIFTASFVFMRFNVDMFVNVGLQQLTRKELALIIAGSMAVGTVMMFLIFYGVLHCWLNFFAELLRFGDKEFYEDWWNSTSFSQYYRRWNVVVHDWLHTYIYKESQRLGCSQSVSIILVSLLSALVHEFLICLSLRFFVPVLLMLYATFGILVVFITKQRTSQFWNTFMWLSLFGGWGIMIFSYTTEWYARINCPKEETALDFFIPRSWDASCRILNIS